MAQQTTPAPVQQAHGVTDSLVHSYLFMRRGVGVIGVGLPFALAIGYAVSTHKAVLRNSISSYYYTDMRNVFVGSLCAIGVFLICYRFNLVDDVLSTIAGVLAIAVALCPTAPDNPTDNALMASRFHYIFAGGLFILLAVFCFVLFPRKDPDFSPARRKPLRNRIYIGCGVVIVVSLLFAGATQTIWSTTFIDTNVLFWCESVAIFAFGASWLIKGQTLLKG
jgi:hypothetical protein